MSYSAAWVSTPWLGYLIPSLDSPVLPVVAQIILTAKLIVPSRGPRAARSAAAKPSVAGPAKRAVARSVTRAAQHAVTAVQCVPLSPIHFTARYLTAALAGPIETVAWEATPGNIGTFVECQARCAAGFLARARKGNFAVPPGPTCAVQTAKWLATRAGTIAVSQSRNAAMEHASHTTQEQMHNTKCAAQVRTYAETGAASRTSIACQIRNRRKFAATRKHFAAMFAATGRRPASTAFAASGPAAIPSADCLFPAAMASAARSTRRARTASASRPPARPAKFRAHTRRGNAVRPVSCVAEQTNAVTRARRNAAAQRAACPLASASS